ncbi:DUF924 family protein [Roseovarius sp. Pro17]|uniref:DUF924 family protein n=1 Tax=Roseovarius sp. Pro17 TaxID=3108175 RepID=UPI002D76EF5A|nr:DUF924 family protein [Roseovarius sp. Pro17]
MELTERSDDETWRRVLDFWFPEGRSLGVDADTHKGHWFWRMRGGAHDEVIRRFTDLTAEAAAGHFGPWTTDPKGRLALIILLDQFSRSVWAGSARAFAQDQMALALTMEGLSNGHYVALPTPWFKVVHCLPLGHCEGPDHLERLDLLIGLREEIAAEAPVQLRPIYRSLVKQARDVKQVIEAFGRHPHRNHLLGRRSTSAEQAYLKSGNFPHFRAFDG